MFEILLYTMYILFYEVIISHYELMGDNIG